MSKHEELYEKLRTISNDDYLTSTCDTWIDTEDKVETMLDAFDKGELKTNDDVLTKILEIEYGRDIRKHES